MARQVKRPGLLDGDGRAQRRGFEIDAPAPGTFGLHGPLNVRKGERKLRVPLLEVDSASIDVDFPKADLGRWTDRANSRRESMPLRRPWKPFAQIPDTIRVADKIQAGARERQRAKLDVAEEKPLPAQFNTERFRAQKILMSEARVFRNGDRLRLERRTAPQAETVSSNFDLPPECRFKMRRQPSLYAGMLNHEGNACVREPNAG